MNGLHNFFMSASAHVNGKRKLENIVEEKLVNLEYRNVLRNRWIRENRVVYVVHSSEFGKDFVRIKWREEWKDDHTIVYDYSSGGTHMCGVCHCSIHV